MWQPDEALHQTAIPLRSNADGEFGRYLAQGSNVLFAIEEMGSP